MRELVPATMLCGAGPGGVLCPSLPCPGFYAQICLPHCLDDTREIPTPCGMAYGQGFAVDRVGISCMGFHVHNQYYACLYYMRPENNIRNEDHLFRVS